MLPKDFYTCYDSRAEGDSYSCRLVFNPAHAIFEGHFPGNPVVPGVCMMEIVRELLQEQVQQPLLLRSTGIVKFLQLIKPSLKPQINITWRTGDEGQYDVKASISDNDTAYFKFDGNYVKA